MKAFKRVSSVSLVALALTMTATLPNFAAGKVTPSSSEWTMDGKHSNAGFSIKHMMVSNTAGSFGKMTGSASYDGKNLAKAKVEATIDVASINTNEPARDKHLRTADFFDVEKYPNITFKSTKIMTAKSGFKIVGDLTMHGVTKSVTLDAEPLSPIVDDGRGNLHVGTTATTKIKRTDFGIAPSTASAMLGEEVKVTLDVDMMQKTKTAAK